jgi:hypothetical protein
MSDEEYESDGLDSFSLDQIGMKLSAFGGARMLKLTTADVFATREGEVISSNRELVALGLKKFINKFVGKTLVDTIIVPNNEKVPDIEKMNEAAPREEWSPDPYNDGKMKGPYVLVLVLKLIDLVTLDRFAFVTQSKGGAIAIGDLTDKTKIMRRLRGRDVAPVVTCHTIAFPIKKRNIIKRRPDFRVARWIRFGGDGNIALPTEPPRPVLVGPAEVKPPPAATATVAATAAATAAKPVELPQRPAQNFTPPTTSPVRMTLAPIPGIEQLGPQVAEPTLPEEMDGDAVPF